MRVDDAQALIRSTLDTGWATTEKRYPNEDINPPRNKDGAAAPFVLLEFLDAADEQMSIGSPGNNLFRRSGTCFVHVLVPRGTGDGTALLYAQDIGALFRGRDLGGVTCEGASIGGGGPGDDTGNYWRRSVAIDFWFDDTA